MREAAFKKQNMERWQQTEKWLATPYQLSSDKLADLFVQLTDDLAFAQTQYPESTTTQYINQLASRVHILIYRNKKEKSNRFKTFWQIELPLLFWEVRFFLLYALLFFCATAAIGVFSAAYDDTFVRLVLGDAYVNQTLYNIERGDPMAIYKDSNELIMFFQIAVNNIRVSFITFAFGVFIPLAGTCWILFHNGIMVGSFQYFFYSKGLLGISAVTIWLHGTLEIAAIIIAGAAGWIVGNSIIFPETYSRVQSFRMGASKGLKIVIGLMPFFLVAAFIESFLTRYTEMPLAIKLMIIGASFAFLIWYVVIYPARLARSVQKLA